MKKLFYIIVFIICLNFAHAETLSYGKGSGYTNWSTTSCVGKTGCTSQVFYKYSDQSWSSATTTVLSAQYKYSCYKESVDTSKCTCR